MLRLLLFALLFVLFVAITAPLERVVTPWLAGPLTHVGVALELSTLRLALPAGIRATDLRLHSENFSVDLDSLYVGILRSFAARGCGGARLDGNVTSDGFAVQVSDLNPSRCIKVGRLTIDGPFAGSLSISGISPLHAAIADNAEARIDLRTSGGTFGGYVPGGAESPAADVAIGEWEFQQAALVAIYRNGKLEVREGRARTDGVQWELLGASFLRERGAEREVRIDLRARIEEDTPRAKALLGLMPKAGENAGGWRHFRVVGPPTSMKLIGLQ